MKQILQSYKTGEISLFEVPAPSTKPGGVLVRNMASLISMGTERLMINTGKKSLLGKCLARPDLVRQALHKAKKEGFLNVYKEAMNRLDEPVPLGYSSAGVIVEVAAGTRRFKVGDRVACAGAGFASHAEVVWVPENLCVKIPEGVGFEEASFVMLGGIALQGIRSAEITFGENVAVIGLGLLGLLTVQILNAYSSNVIGIDIDEKKVTLSKELGAERALVNGKDDVLEVIGNLTQGQGVDTVIITASSKDNGPIELAEQITRKRGKIVLVGVSDLHLSRKIFWEKELEFTVSKAAGPGSTEPVYEQKGFDYPVSYVRWTEKRNLEHFLELLAKKRVRVDKLITHRFPIEEALFAYHKILNGKEPSIGILLHYNGRLDKESEGGLAAKVILKSSRAANPQSKQVGLIGGGFFAKNILLPALKKVPRVILRGIATTQGVSSQHSARKFGFEYCTSNYHDILENEAIDSVIIATRHHLHARMVIEVLKAGKHLFVEKPLCLNEDELREIVATHRSLGQSAPKLMVGFNRRFSLLANEVKSFLRARSTPLVIHYRVNAGYLPRDHWTQDPEVGGGRVVGEICHFIDFLQFMTDSFPVSVFAEGISGETGRYSRDDNLALTIKFRDGSLGTILYTTHGPKTFSRERVEIFSEDSAFTIEDFRVATAAQRGKLKRIKKWSQDLGYVQELNYFLKADSFNSSGLFQSYFYTTLSTLKGKESLQRGSPVTIPSLDQYVEEKVF